MAISLVIAFEGDPQELLHRVRNFGEDIYSLLPSKKGWGEIDIYEVDAATTRLVIRKIKGSQIRRVKAWVEAEMARQHLDGRLETITNSN